MEDHVQVDDRYLQVRRVLTAIAYENGRLDDEERQFLTSSLVDEFPLSEQQLATLLHDATARPTVKDLVADITDPMYTRLLLVELLNLAVAKYEWDSNELSAARSAIETLHLPQEAKGTFRQAFDLLVPLDISPA